MTIIPLALDMSMGDTGSTTPPAVTAVSIQPSVAEDGVLGPDSQAKINSLISSPGSTCDGLQTPLRGSPGLHGLSRPQTPKGSDTSTQHRLQSSITHSAYRESVVHPSRSYEPDASIALVGIRGSGLSSLAVMASSALGFRLVDADRHFYETTGISRGAYRSTYGVTKYRQEELRQMRSILLDNQARAVIACGPGAVEETGQTLLAEYAKRHPIIYVMRDTDGIQKHLSVSDPRTVLRLVNLSSPIHRALSSFEFYNLDELSLFEPPESGANFDVESHQSLALKHVERDFLRLIHGIRRRAGIGDKDEGHPGLSSLPPEAREYSYALSLPIKTAGELDCRLQSMNTSADVIELVVSFEEFHQKGGLMDNSFATLLSRQFYTVVRNLGLPIIFHVDVGQFRFQTGRDGDSAGPELAYFDVLQHGLRLAPEYLTVDLNCNEQMIRRLNAVKGSTKIIGHLFDRNPEPNGWASFQRSNVVKRAEELGCDIVRLAQQATVIEDNFAVQNFLHKFRTSGKQHIPVIAYNSGSLGRMSNFLNPILTPVTHSSLAISLECPPSSLITIEEAQRALYASFTLDPMKFGVYGGNVGSSLTPVLYNTTFRESGMPHQYYSFQYQSLVELKRLVQEHNFGGLNIAAPFKREIIPLVHRMSREAQAIGAVNTLLPLRTTDGHPLLDSNRSGPVVALYGDNTDWIGIYSSIRLNLSPINAVRRRTTALIIGAGGMARAAAYAVLRSGVHNIFVYNRTLQNAEELARQFHGRRFFGPRPIDNGLDLLSSQPSINSAHQDPPANTPVVRVLRSKDEPWPDDADFPTIILSTLPHSVNQEPVADNTVPKNWLASPTGGVAMELAYTPAETPLMKQVRDLSDHGWIAVDGLQVLPEQGKVQFELFTGRKAPQGVLEKVVREAYRRQTSGKDMIESSAIDRPLP